MSHADASHAGRAPGSIDIVIPTLNEASRLESCLDCLRVAIAALEAHGRPSSTPVEVRVFVADAGSTDRTREIANAMGATVLDETVKGRGQQLHMACEAGEGDVVLMLHADARIREDGLIAMFRALVDGPRVTWGILGGRFDRRRFRMVVLECLNRMRFSVAGVAFGDQGIFARRRSLEDAGGVPAIPLMEDVELSLRLKPTGHRYSIGSGLTVSARRWDERPFFKSFFHVIKICTEYMIRRRCGTDIHELSSRMYREYYGDPHEGAG